MLIAVILAKRGSSAEGANGSTAVSSIEVCYNPSSPDLIRDLLNGGGSLSSDIGGGGVFGVAPALFLEVGHFGFGGVILCCPEGAVLDWVGTELLFDEVVGEVVGVEVVFAVVEGFQ
jgi:hypothetical protein